MSDWVKNFPLLMNRVGMAPIAKSVLKCINIYFYCISALFASFFVESGFVGSRTRGLHGLDWVSYKSDASAVSTTANISLRKFRGR